MSIERYKEQTIEGRDFRIGLVTASVGNWVIAQIYGGRAGNSEVFDKVKNYLFNEISVYIEKSGVRAPMRIYDNGKWLMPEFEYDLELNYQLYGAAMAWNFDPFFERRKKEEAERKRLAEQPSDTSQ